LAAVVLDVAVSFPASHIGPRASDSADGNTAIVGGPVHLNTQKGTNEARHNNGHVVFVGDQRILFYDYALHKVQLYQWKDVDEVHESGFD
jgi:hypothetical protein